ncbi:MAG TPA: galactose-1-epimerase, partial [Sphingomonas sp.]|nr:galactose-1-epimerase [Sphingomonas sp.]
MRIFWSLAAFTAGIGVVPSTAIPAMAATAKRSDFGATKDGTAIQAVTLTGTNGVSARIITYGATLQALSAPDRTGKIADITLGYDTI